MTVTFFGHRDAPQSIETTLNQVLTDLLEKEDSVDFYVGNNGSFDSMVYRQLKVLSAKYSFNYYVVLAYIPEKKTDILEFSETIIPEGIENVPKRFAILWRNKWMLKHSDIVITYVCYPSAGSSKFKELAEKQRKIVINLTDI